MPSAKLSVQLEALLGSSWGNLSKAAQQIQDFEAKAQSAGAALTATFTLPIALLGRAAIKSGAELDGLNRSMVAIEGSAEGASKRIKILNEIAKLPGLNFKDVVQGDVNLRSAGLSAELAARSMSSFGNALGILGKTGGLGNVNAQIQQMATKTQGFGADLKILKEWVPQVSVALQNAFGTTNADMIEKMGNTGKEVVTKLIAELEKLPKATGGIGNALENMDDAWFKFTGRIGLAIDKAVDLSGIFNKVSDTLNDLASWFEKLDPSTQKIILGFTGAVAIAGPLMLALGALPSLIGAVATGASLLGGLFSGPLVIGIGAGIMAFKMIKEMWWDTKSELQKTQFLDDLSYYFKKTFGVIGDAVSALKNFVTLEWADMFKDMDSITQTLGQGVVNGISKFVANKAEAMGFKDYAKNVRDRLRTYNRDIDGPIVIGDRENDIREIDPLAKTGATPPKLGGGGTGEAKKDYWKEYIEDTRLATMAGKGFDEAMEKIRITTAELKNDLLKNGSPIANIIPTDLPAKMETALGGAVGKMDALMVQMRENFKNRGLEIKEAIDQMYTDILNTSINKGIQDMAGGMAEWVGAFAVGVKSFADLGNLLKSIFGDLMITTGKQMLTIAISTEAFEKAIEGIGGAAIPIALGLIAAGSAVKASASKSSGASYQQVPQNSVSNYQPIYQPTNTGSNGSAGGRVSIEITQNKSVLRGNDLVYLEQKTQYGESRGFGVTKG